MNRYVVVTQRIAAPHILLCINPNKCTLKIYSVLFHSRYSPLFFSAHKPSSIGFNYKGKTRRILSTHIVLKYAA